ncbi:hypothetical protein Mapa_009168 [Marchantia paleacea]|nr:hypothetical protein Mapa_009168 [Marchantia paleacea]
MEVVVAGDEGAEKSQSEWKTTGQNVVRDVQLQTLWGVDTCIADLFGQSSLELVVLQVDVSEVAEQSKLLGNAGQEVVGEIHIHQGQQLPERGRNGTVELVVIQTQASEKLQVSEAGRDLSGELVVVELELLQGFQPSEHGR